MKVKQIKFWQIPLANDRSRIFSFKLNFALEIFAEAIEWKIGQLKIFTRDNSRMFCKAQHEIEVAKLFIMDVNGDFNMLIRAHEKL